MNTKDRILSETPEAVKEKVRETANDLVGNSKQETLEEEAKKYANELPEPYNYGLNTDKKKGFIAGAKWQQERMYSEEEVLELLLNRPGPYLSDEEIKKWFEQFKKK